MKKYYKDKPKRETRPVDFTNIVNKKIRRKFPPLHVMLDLIKQYSKTLDKDSEIYRLLSDKHKKNKY